LNFSIKNLILPATFLLLTGSCRERPVPKPHGFFRIAFPEKSYRMMDSIFPYRFEIPTYAKIIHDPQSPGEPNWINIEVSDNKAEIHISYYKVESNRNSGSTGFTGSHEKSKKLAQLIEDSRKFVYKHTIKADAINEQVFLNRGNNVFGTIYLIEGNAASPLQFYLTDSTANFLRGALYIREVPNIDSLKPVIEFLKVDIIRLIESTSWKNGQQTKK
jgi:gliding motility-associated lipoprotein GldD